MKCFYYLFCIPLEWRKFMGFARVVPPSCVPACWQGEACHLVARVLPMGFPNSVGLAQHMHRKCCQAKPCSQQPLEVEPHELRRDRPAPVGKNEEPVRVYLDNWDELKKVDRSLCAEVEGKSSVHQLALRQQYMNVNLPRPPKKSVEGACHAEIQGALLDGRSGVAFAKPEKIMKYGVGMGAGLLEPGWSVPAGNRLATFTTSRPSDRPGRRPAGLHSCDEATLRRWKADLHRYPPHQYKEEFCVHHASGHPSWSVK